MEFSPKRKRRNEQNIDPQASATVAVAVDCISSETRRPVTILQCKLVTISVAASWVKVLASTSDKK